ncbi:hypothetical protein [Bradyrhizobium sp. Arg816]|uniref:hypothetical protein n=1 Tax=Bradyrhizobium sp. Arg816 TaxID=2998491 RepID=UPI00249ED6C1|nr:hypothetical protein [Bradyrhizobium sp. Arg816]MDI3566251.1 hypothetical protein [Bradyrhizobium sp. Arg816]
MIKATLSNVKVINAASGIGVGAGAAVHLSNSVVSSNSVAGIAISGGGINIDAATISFNTIGIKQVGGSVNCPTMTFRSTAPACPARSTRIRTIASRTTVPAERSRQSAARPIRPDCSKNENRRAQR